MFEWEEERGKKKKKKMHLVGSLKQKKKRAYHVRKSPK